MNNLHTASLPAGGHVAWPAFPLKEWEKKEPVPCSPPASEDTSWLRFESSVFEDRDELAK